MKNIIKELRLVGFIGCVFILFFAGMTTGCTEDHEPIRPGPTDGSGGGTNQTNQGDSDTGDPDVDEPPGESCDEECEDGEVCHDDECIQLVEGISCMNPMELDVSEAGTVTATLNPQQEPILDGTTCADEESPQGVFSLSVETASRLTARVSDSQFASPLIKELRVGQCDNETMAEWCSINTQNWIAEPDTDYFIIVEADAQGLVGEFELEVEVEPLVCNPGERSCDGGDRTYCAGGDQIVTYSCVDGCVDGKCVGDGCANPFETTETGKTVSTSLSSYHNNFDFSSDTANCSSSGSGVTTSGQDLVFSLPGLDAGQTVEVLLPEVDESSYAIGVMKTCLETAPDCVYGHTTSGDFEWMPQEAGDYFLVINRFSLTSDDDERQFEVLVGE